MNEFLTTFSSDQSVLWAVFILGAVIAAALGLSLAWSTIFRLASIISALTNTTPSGPEDVLP